MAMAQASEMMDCFLITSSLPIYSRVGHGCTVGGADNGWEHSDRRMKWLQVRSPEDSPRKDAEYKFKSYVYDENFLCFVLAVQPRL